MLNERIDKWTDGHRLEGKKWLQGWTGQELAADATALMSSRREQLAAGGCGDHLRLNQLHLCPQRWLLNVLFGRESWARSQEDGIPPLFLLPKILYASNVFRDNHP